MRPTASRQHQIGQQNHEETAHARQWGQRTTWGSVWNPCCKAGPEREQLRPQVERPAKPGRQLEGHVRKGILQLPPCVKTHGQRGHRDLIQHMIIVVLRAMVQA